MTVDPDHVLHDGVVRLRPLDAADAERTRSWRNDPSVWARTMGFRLPITESMEQQWFASLAADNGLTRVVFAIDALDASGTSGTSGTSDELVGFVQLNEIDWPSRTASFGILIGDETRRGKGYGRRTLALVTAYAKDQLGLRKLTLKVVATNEDATALYRSSGWVEEGRQREQFYVGGVFEDVVLMGRFLT
jgi:RimJ/RimL family protein N-acetyltransferase